MSLRTRLQRLERTQMDTGSPVCRDRRGRIVQLTARRLPDGTVVSVEDKPQSCSCCGQVPEQIIEVIESVVESPTGQAAFP
jgi:hypothetical protein